MKRQATIRIEEVEETFGTVAVLTSNNKGYEKVLSRALAAQFGGAFWQEVDPWGGVVTYYYNGEGLYEDKVNAIRSK